MKSIKKQLIEEYRNKFGLNGLYAKPVEYMNYEDIYDKVEQFISQVIDRVREETIREVKIKIQELADNVPPNLLLNEIIDKL